MFKVYLDKTNWVVSGVCCRNIIVKIFWFASMKDSAVQKRVCKREDQEEKGAKLVVTVPSWPCFVSQVSMVNNCWQESANRNRVHRVLAQVMDHVLQVHYLKLLGRWTVLLLDTDWQPVPNSGYKTPRWDQGKHCYADIHTGWGMGEKEEDTEWNCWFWATKQSLALGLDAMGCCAASRQD